MSKIRKIYFIKLRFSVPVCAQLTKKQSTGLFFYTFVPKGVQLSLIFTKKKKTPLWVISFCKYDIILLSSLS